MMERPDELEAFKTLINLTEYAAARVGYLLDRTKSSRNSAVIKNPETSRHGERERRSESLREQSRSRHETSQRSVSNRNARSRVRR